MATVINEYRPHLLSLYLAAFNELGILASVADIKIQDDFTCDLLRADEYVLAHIPRDDGMTINSYQPGKLTISLEAASDYLNAVLPTAAPEFQKMIQDRREASIAYACEHWFTPLRLIDPR